MKHILEVCLVAALAAGITPSIGAQSQTVMQKGISVQLAIAGNAVPMPDADQEDALIVTITADGGVYLGVNPITPAALTAKVKDRLSNRPEKKLYIKADARTQYTNVAKVLDAARAAGVDAPNLLTAQSDSSQHGTLVPPRGLEVLVGPPLPSGPEATIVQLRNSGQQWPTVKINGGLVPWASLQNQLSQLLQNRTKTVVLVKAEETSSFADVAAVTDLCRAAGAQVVLATPEL
jgi:biopolymer transport protein TolR